MILVTQKEKPLPRTGKGTLMRKAALKDYHYEIKMLYVFLSFCLLYELLSDLHVILGMQVSRVPRRLNRLRLLSLGEKFMLQSGF